MERAKAKVIVSNGDRERERECQPRNKEEISKGSRWGAEEREEKTGTKRQKGRKRTERTNTRGVYGLLLPSRSSSLANRYTTSAPTIMPSR